MGVLIILAHQAQRIEQRRKPENSPSNLRSPTMPCGGIEVGQLFFNEEAS